MQAPPPNLNLPPDVAAALQEQVSKMSPAQMAAMMESMKGVDMNAAAAQAQAALAGLSADQVRSMGAAMASTTPEAVRANVSAVNARLAAEVAGAGKLKADGNAAFAKGEFAAAADAWSRAAQSLEAHTSTEAVTLRRACQLNCALAHLKLEAWTEAEAAASSVLKADASNAKALLRRGSALLGLKKVRAAVKDLEAALRAAAPDDKAVVREKLEEARALLVEDDGTVEEADEGVEEVAAAPAPPPPPPVLPGMGGMGAMPTGASAAAQAAQMRAFAAALRANPSLKDAVAAQAASMTPQQVQDAARAAGAAAPPPEALTPSGMAMAAQAASAMTPEQLEAMADALENSGGVPAGVRATSGAPPPPADVAALMKDPAMIKQAAEMMKTMDPKAVAAMSGGAVSEAQAAAMQEKLGKLSEAQLEKLVSAAQTVQAVKARLEAAKAWLVARPSVVAAVVALLVAVLLRRWGWV